MEVSKVEGDEFFDLRKFDPSTCGFGPDALPSEVLESTSRCPLVHLVRKTDKRFTFVLYADGACLGNGTEAARASVGVYGTPDAWYNEGSLLPPYLAQTNQSAEIYSAIAAIKVARGVFKKRMPHLRKCRCGAMVVLVMDSSYVVQAMTEWIRKWRANGFRNARGLPVANAQALKKLDYDIRQAYLEKYIIVRFWHVRRMYNSGADKMARQAFRENRFLDLKPEDCGDSSAEDCGHSSSEDCGDSSPEDCGDSSPEDCGDSSPEDSDDS